MKPTRIRGLLLIAIMIILTSLACQFLSDLSGEIPTQPPFYYVDDRVLMFVPEVLPNAFMGEDYEVRIDIENVSTFVGEFSISEGEMPEGLSLERIKSENAVKIVGIPQGTGTYSFTLKVQCMGTNNPGQEGEKAYTIEVGGVSE